MLPIFFDIAYDVASGKFPAEESSVIFLSIKELDLAANHVKECAKGRGRKWRVRIQVFCRGALRFVSCSLQGLGGRFMKIQIIWDNCWLMYKGPRMGTYLNEISSPWSVHSTKN